MIFLVKAFVIALAWTFVQSDEQRDKLFLLQKSEGNDNEILLVVTWKKNKDEISTGCEYFTDKDLIGEVLESSNDSPIRTLSEDQMQDIFQDCTEFILRRRRRGTTDEKSSRISSHDIMGDPAEWFWRRSQEQEDKTAENREAPGQSTTHPNSLRSADENREVRRNSTTRSNSSRTADENREVRRNSTMRSSSARTADENRKVRRNSTTRSSSPRTADKNREVRRNSTTRSNSSRTPDDNREDRRESTTPSNSVETTTTAAGYDGMKIIFPTTKWCGAGDVSGGNVSNLGMSEYTDRCCRAHDLCNDTLAPGETRYNLTNDSSFTKLSCECDDDFYNCLEQVNSFASNTIGNMYFNILRRECYKEDYPLTKICKDYRSILKITCKEYERDTSAPKVYQWISAKRYTKIPIPLVG